MNTPLPDDRTLFALVADGASDPSTWRQFVDRFSRLCYHAIHRVLARQPRLEHGEVEEVFQRFFLRLLEHDRALMRRYRGDNGCAPGTYLSHLAAFQALEYVREHSRRSRTFKQTEQPITHSAEPEQMGHSPEEELQVSEEAIRVRRAIARLKPNDKLLYTLYYEQGLSLVEIARMLNKTETAVHVQHHRLKDRLRQALTEPSEAAVGG